MALDIPLPTASPQNDPDQYIPLLLSAIEGFLLAKDVWEVDDYPQAYSYMQELMEYIVDLMEGEIVERSIGEIIMFPTSSPPDKWLVCDGSAISRTTYADLFAVLSTDYGSGDGTTTFNIPDFRDVSPMGIGTVVMGFGAVQGELEVTLNTANMPVHNHGITDPGHTHGITDPGHVHRERVGNGANAFVLGAGGGANSTVAGNTTTNTAAMNTGSATTGETIDSGTTGISTNNAGGAEAHSNLHPVIGTSFLIYAGVV